ncbi:MAG: autotransporter-associated beta strand repeat-containing protein [Verrucomicrobiota bacterium]
MKHRNPTLRSWLLALSAGTAITLTVHAGTTSTTFSIQKGNLTQDGNAYGSGTSYTGAVDGALADGSAASARTTTATSTLGNQYHATPSGNNGQQYCGLFSYDLTELNSYIAANTGSYSSVSIQSVSFQLISAGSVSGSYMTLGLYGTDPFTSGATWSNYTTGTAWTVPYQSLAAPNNTALYGYTGGPSALTASLGAASPGTTVVSGSPLTWTTNANFISTCAAALARADKTLYLTARGTYFSNGDNRLSINFSPAVVALRPKLTVTLQVTTTAAPATWTGTSSTSWATAANWSTSAVPATDAPIIFNSSSTANLNTVLNQDFTVTSVTVASPSAMVSVSGANNLNLGAGGFDLSAATQSLAVSAPIVLTAPQTWNIAAGQSLSVSGAVTGSSQLTLAGAGKISLGASNILPNGASAGNLIVSGTLDLDGSSQSVNGLSGSGIVDNTAAGASVLSVGNNNVTTTFDGILQNTSGTLAVAKTGSGQLTLTGANTFSGGFTNNSVCYVVPSNNLAFGSGPVVLNAGTIYAVATTTFANTLALNGATLRIGGGNSHTVTWNGPVTATGTSGLTSDGGTGGITLGSTLDIAGATFSSYASGTTHTITGDVSGAGGNLNVAGGTLQLSGTGTYTGTTTLSGSAVLRLQPTGTISSSSNIVINGAGNLNIRNTGGWSYSGSITGDGSGSITPTSGTNATLAGNISGVAGIYSNSAGTATAVSGDISGAVAVTVQGGAILTLSGNNSAMTGSVTLNGATASTLLALKSAAALGTGNLAISGGNNGEVDNTSGAALTLSSNNAQAWNSDFRFIGSDDLNLGSGAVTLGGNRVIYVSAKTLSVGGDIGGAYGITKNNGGTLALTGSSSYTGNTIIAQGTLKLGAAGSIASSASVTINAGATLDTSAQATYAIPGAQPLALGIDASASGSSGRIVAADLDITNAIITYNFTGTPSAPVYVLATYTGLTGTAFASASTPPSGYTLDYAYQGDKIALVQGGGSGYSAWQAANSSAGGLNADHDNDGVSNGIEYFVGGTTNTTGFTALPDVTQIGGTHSVTWTKAGTYPGVYPIDFVVETSTTLVGTWTPAALGTGAGQVEITGNDVKYTFPAGTRNFARLKVTGP